ncbi:MAG: hypothetical protein A2654_00170 [Candidatus Nealsonbacteria bacterium RIFCSPHIGHO2_01_FULL_43_31]|uniref:Uncharacterized protein n=2 Tax=Candidatus Nealsoniibacteriota TaxID=1817911 RepID=A0A1G2E6Z7_9BACT|nr:MAG: hypothetical protein UV98_C0035G0006 [Parcubacteria group bacterium GW2011_GWB1_43_6]OGZ19818.1 MAG: hypothetical protein A2654_00170 [Candidatus Nealsonbacteria bacterium RIFCSPHIGHO2_01_FULL_43_31]OGZ21499.1 MAG: hypothetical protein A3D46_00015 [Candidatus Nealsonbacteria bacterium RIFCSPHIGHO2_02_FULL_43_13]OGZ24775.1 MAG: hypothetical protein A2922_00735 [Candidatus Nealsonbacteria bacterium RIFCSPLOWO2_01_FULL_43_36]
MISQIAYFLVFGKPIIFHTGVLTLVFFLLAALIGYLNFKGIRTIPFKWHPRVVAVAILLGLIHGFLGLSIYFNL